MNINAKFIKPVSDNFPTENPSESFSQVSLSITLQHQNCISSLDIINHRVSSAFREKESDPSPLP